MAIVTVNYPNMAKDTELEIPNRGVYLNGHAYNVEWAEEDLVLGEPLEGKVKVLPDPMKTAAEERERLRAEKDAQTETVEPEPEPEPVPEPTTETEGDK